MSINFDGWLCKLNPQNIFCDVVTFVRYSQKIAPLVTDF